MANSPTHQQPVRTDAPQVFEHGYPTTDTAQRVRNDADFQRAVTAYRFWYPTVSGEGILTGFRNAGMNENEHLMIQNTKPHHVFFTPNSDTPYGLAILDLSDGPYIVDVPPGTFIGLVNDHHQGWILDMGLPGPAGANGGKHLVVPPAYTGQIPSGYFTGTSHSNKVMVALRSIPSKGDVKAALDALRMVKIYPLATASSPKPLTVVDVTTKPFDATCLRWEDNLDFWRTLATVLESEPLVPHFLPMYGELAAVGIEKGKPFKPDARMAALLERAAKTGRDQILVSAFASARADRFAWKDRKWEWAGLVPDSAQFETRSGMDLEARDRWFAQAIVTSPAMFRRSIGAGSLYWLGTQDASGAYLDGGHTYKLTVPLPVPSSLFWSVTVYDAETRSEVQTPQDKAALRSLFELKDMNSTKSVDLFFGPHLPSGQSESRWIQTIPGKGWFAYFRVYGPEGSVFDGSWKPGDFQRVPQRGV
jgi:hypothetical protein